MSLDTLEGLPAEVAALYKKGEDDKFHLETDGLKSALQKERERANNAEKAVKDRETKEAADKAEFERKKLEEKGEYEKLNAASKAEREQLTKELADEKAARAEYIKETTAASTLAAAGLPANRFLVAEMKKSLEVVDGKLQVKGDPSKTPAQLLEVLKRDPECAGLFPATGNGGGSAQPSTTKTDAHTRFAELNKKAAEKPLTQSESMEVMRLGDQISKETKP